MIQQVFEEEQARGRFEEPEGVPREVYRDESDKLYIEKEFTLEEFEQWYAVQRLGGRPFNAVGYYHTALPDVHHWAGLGHLTNIFD